MVCLPPAAFTGAMSNSPPSFSESYYLDSVSDDVEDDGLLTSVTCTDADGENLTVNVTSDLPFHTRVDPSDGFANQFDIVIMGSADLSMESSGITFTLVCSDGVASDMAVVVLNVVPSKLRLPSIHTTTAEPSAHPVVCTGWNNHCNVQSYRKSALIYRGVGCMSAYS